MLLAMWLITAKSEEFELVVGLAGRSLAWFERH
jgi:hypothetical protein